MSTHEQPEGSAEEEGAAGPEQAAPSAWGRYKVPVTIASAAVLGASLIHNETEAKPGPPQPAPAAAVGAPRPAAQPAGPAQSRMMDPLPRSDPDRIRIPTIAVDAPVTKVGLENDGWIGAPPPEDKNLTGWYRDAPSPGERGTAIIDGHVDNIHGPAVFYGLGALKKGDRIEVTRHDGRTAVFDIYGIEVFSKDNFPGDRVYGDTGKPELRLITCGGGFTKKHGYDGNVVVFARMSEAY